MKLKRCNYDFEVGLRYLVVQVSTPSVRVHVIIILHVLLLLSHSAFEIKEQYEAFCKRPSLLNSNIT